jgi:hypothetical protein
MCTRANRRSVPESLHALVGIVVAFASALFVLVVAVVTFPVRLVRPRPTKHGNPASTEHVEVQVHLDNRERVGAIEHSCRAALKRAARTWAPYPLPLDRVEVLSSAPPLGKVDIYERWMAEPNDASPPAGSLVVVAIGTALEARELTPDEIAGALASQIERLVIDRYKREHPQEQPTPPSTREPQWQPVVVHGSAMVIDPARASNPPPDNVTELNSVRALLADIKKSQPLVPAGPSQNGVHREPEPA